MLDLTRNNLGQRTVAELAAAFSAIPPTVTSLNLSWNGLSRRTTEELVQIIAAIPGTISQLILVIIIYLPVSQSQNVIN